MPVHVVVWVAAPALALVLGIIQVGHPRAGRALCVHPRGACSWGEAWGHAFEWEHLAGTP